MKVVETFSESRSLSTGRVGLVPTMGFLHEGHLSHIHRARETSDTVVVSLFVNPLQFEDEADLDRYPRDVGRDAALASAGGRAHSSSPSSRGWRSTSASRRRSSPARP